MYTHESFTIRSGTHIINKVNGLNFILTIDNAGLCWNVSSLRYSLKENLNGIFTSRTLLLCSIEIQTDRHADSRTRQDWITHTTLCCPLPLTPGIEDLHYSLTWTHKHTHICFSQIPLTFHPKHHLFIKKISQQNLGKLQHYSWCNRVEKWRCVLCDGMKVSQ